MLKGSVIKNIAAALLLFGSITLALSQGRVSFLNTGNFPTPADRNVYYNGFGGPLQLLVGTNYVVQLYYGADVWSLQAHTAAPSRFRIPTTASPGTWSGGTRTLTGFGPGSVVTMQLRVWDIRLGPTFESTCNQAQVNPRAVSQVFMYTVPPSNSAPHLYLMDNFRAFGFPINGLPCFPPLVELDYQDHTVEAGTDLTLSARTPFPDGAFSVEWRFNGTNSLGAGYWTPGSSSSLLLITNIQVAQSGTYHLIARNFAGYRTSEVAMVSVTENLAWAQVLFANHVLSSRVRFPDGSGVVGTNYVAQLYYGSTTNDLIAVTNRPAKFRPSFTPAPGTWIGGRRVLPGINPGEAVWMQVRFWDADYGSTFEEAMTNQGYGGASAAFGYTAPASGSPWQAYYMTNFPGFSNACASTGPVSILVQPVSQAVEPGANVTFSVVSTNACYHRWFFGNSILSLLNGGLPRLHLTNANATSQSGEYRVVAYGADGSSVTSQVAVLKIARSPRLASLTRVGNDVAFFVTGSTGQAFVVESAIGIEGPGPVNWLPIYTNVTPFWFTNTLPAMDRQKFYRAVFR